MIRPLTIAHTSDVHLDGGSEGAAARESFVRVIDAVIDNKAELFLIAGDLFDHNRIAGDLIDFVYTQLSRVACPTVIITGNHDCWDESSVLRRMDFRAAGHHVVLLDEPEGRQVEFPELHATVWGRCLVDHDLSNKPMAGCPPRTRDLWHIGMAHGLYAEEGPIPRSSLIMPDEIESSGLDYLALGHMHVHSQMRHGNTLACYPGVCTPSWGAFANGCITMVTLDPGEGARAVAHPLDIKAAVPA